jgi:hypothetical protein
VAYREPGTHEPIVADQTCWLSASYRSPWRQRLPHLRISSTGIDRPASGNGGGASRETQMHELERVPGANHGDEHQEKREEAVEKLQLKACGRLR